MSLPFTILRWTNEESLPAITALLHRAYRPLAEQGLRYVASYQDELTTRQRLEGGEPFLALYQDQIVGTITLYPPLETSPADWYRHPDIWHIGQFAVEPAQQGLGIGHALLTHAESLARSKQAREIALDTAEHAHQLLAYYGKRGYHEVGYVRWELTNYRSIILSKKL